MTVVKVNLETITPLWTGDAWGENTEIKPQSIMGALRFWFEVYCHSVGIPVNDYKGERVDLDKFRESLKFKVKGNTKLDEAEDKVLAETGISLSSRIFGCTGWKGQVEIKNRIEKKNLGFYDYWQGKLQIPKHRGWFFPRRQEWFFGNINIFLSSNQNITKSVIKPLLNFIQKYGFIGGKNNLGYGGVRFTVDSNPITEEAFGLSHFHRQGKEKLLKYYDTPIYSAVAEVPSFKDLINCKKISLWKQGKLTDSASLKRIIRSLISFKAEQRRVEKNKYLRHFLFGSVREVTGPNATKIIPWINKTDDGCYESGFLSLACLQYFNKKP